MFKNGDLIYVISELNESIIVYASLEIIKKSNHTIHKGLKKVDIDSYGIIINHLYNDNEESYYKCLIGNEVVILSNKNIKKV